MLISRVERRTETKLMGLFGSETVTTGESGNIKCNIWGQACKFCSKLLTEHGGKRHNKWNQLKLILTNSRIAAKTLTQQERATEASHTVTWVLGKHKKAFSDATIMKEGMREVTDKKKNKKMKWQRKKKLNSLYRFHCNKKSCSTSWWLINSLTILWQRLSPCHRLVVEPRDNT